LAMQVKNGGHFNKIIVMIDKMIALLREEEQDDIDHKNRCESAINKNKLDIEDLNHEIDRTQKTLDRLGNEETELRDAIKAEETKINATQTDLDEAKKLRIVESEEFIQGLRDDAAAIKLVEEAIVALDRFYKTRSAPILTQARTDPEADPDKPPTEPWTDEYEGRKGEGHGVIAILEMIKEDLEKEVKTARENDGEAQVMYEKDTGSMRESLQKQTATKVALEKEAAALGMKIEDLEEHKSAKGDDLDAENTRKEALDKDCSWVETHFDSRRTKRKAEIDGLIDAKHYLAGMDTADAV